MKKVVIAGGTGFLGGVLASFFRKQDAEVIVISRRDQQDEPGIRYVQWDGRKLGAWVNELSRAAVLINLTGKSVDCRYTDANKQEIYNSRLSATKVLGLALGQCEQPPGVWINASSATIYRHAEDRDMDEATGELGEGFSVNVCEQWERAFFDTYTPNIRKVALRIAIVLGKEGGALHPLKRLVQWGLGGQQGNGRQFFSWIHEDDFVKVVDWVIQNKAVEGVYNVAAPNPVPNREFMSSLRKVMRQSIGLPAPKWLLEIGAWFIQTETALLLKSRRVIPGRLLKEGFRFSHQHLEQALVTLVKYCGEK